MDKNNSMKKIVILGGCGYIGTQLCKLYFHDQFAIRKYNITVIDNRFLPERVKQLKRWGINYIQGDILDEQLMKEQLKDTDYVYHLAGITDVAYTKTEINDEKDKKITEVGTKGSEIIINNIPDKCKILFPSSHVLFEGLKETTFDITEDNIKPCPELSYSKSKYNTEEYLKKSNKNYIICRLGSNYGYGLDSMRINILPNLFSKMASQNKTLKLFSGGKQWKSLIDVRDVARSFKFLMENNDINKQVFNISNENMTVKDVAYLCKKIKPSINIIETKDEIPNEGYTISSLKLLDYGFKFNYSIEESLKEMIECWDFDDIYIEKDEEMRMSNYLPFDNKRKYIITYE